MAQCVWYTVMMRLPMIVHLFPHPVRPQLTIECQIALVNQHNVGTHLVLQRIVLKHATVAIVDLLGLALTLFMAKTVYIVFHIVQVF